MPEHTEAFTYLYFGIVVESDLPLPDLGAAKGIPGVTVRFGQVPEQLENLLARTALTQSSPDACLFHLPGVARYLVRNGSEITLMADANADPAAVRLFLLGPVFTALLRQRGCLTLHGSVIETPRGAVVFLGPSASGKSMIAAEFRRRGYRILSDEVCAVPATDPVTILPAGPFLMLWADALRTLNINQGDVGRARRGLEKFILPLASSFAGTQTPLHSLYALQVSSHKGPFLSAVKGFARLPFLVNNSLADPAAPCSRFQRLSEIASRYPLSEAHHSRAVRDVTELTDLVEKELLLG